MAVAGYGKRQIFQNKKCLFGLNRINGLNGLNGLNDVIAYDVTGTGTKINRGCEGSCHYRHYHQWFDGRLALATIRQSHE